ncbi:MAG: heme ABC transporter ATP-binding protein [Jhaorihella sp.]
MLVARGISVRHRRGTVLDGVDFNASPGRVTAIVGPSGAGKSTLLKAITGDLPNGGRITLNGRDIASAHPADLARIRAVLPQATPLAFPFTVIEVMRLAGQGGQSGRDRIVRQALARVGLAGFEGRLFQELSGGEQQRVHLARVLCQVWQPVSEDGDPRWLFLDEPVSSLDIGHQLHVMETLRDFARAGGGVVMVMHDLNLTAMCADSIALMQSGRVLAQDRPEAVLNSDLLSRAYGCRLAVNRAPEHGAYILPQVAGTA